ncbi:hypothetical protein CORC01_02234, partial [Colletotrichum orchidophilum]
PLLTGPLVFSWTSPTLLSIATAALLATTTSTVATGRREFHPIPLPAIIIITIGIYYVSSVPNTGTQYLFALHSQPLLSACLGSCDQTSSFVPPSTTQSRHSSTATPRQLRHSWAIATDRPQRCNVCDTAQPPTLAPNCRSDGCVRKSSDSKVRPLALPVHVSISSWRAIRRNPALLPRQPIGFTLLLPPRRERIRRHFPPHAAVSNRVGPTLQKPGLGLFSHIKKLSYTLKAHPQPRLDEFTPVAIPPSLPRRYQGSLS